jgi:hypothetical protein
LKQRNPSDEIFELAAKCLSELSLETEMEIVLREFSTIKWQSMKTLIERLRNLATVNYLGSLMIQLAAELPSKSLYLARTLLLEPLSERAFVEGFRCFVEMLSHAPLSSEVIELAGELSERLGVSQLSQINSALRTQPREKEVEAKVENLTLKEVSMRLNEGDSETAVALVNTLHSSPRLQVEVHKLFQAAGLSREKVSVRTPDKKAPNLPKKTVNARRLKEESEMAKAEIYSLRAQLSGLKGKLIASQALLRSKEVAYALASVECSLPEVKDPIYIYSYKEKTTLLHRTNLRSGKQSRHLISNCKFKPGCCLSELPGGR